MKRYKISLCLSLVVTAAFLQMGHAAVDKRHWVSYKSNLLNLQVSVPSDWTPVKIPTALAFRYDDLAGGTAGIGILKSAQSGIAIDQAADQEFEHAGKPADWVRTNAKIDGMRAIKIIGIDPKNADHKIVHYYIETPQGTYIVQCQATMGRWSAFSPTFATILSKLKFLP